MEINNTSAHLTKVFSHFEEVVEVALTELVRLHNEGISETDGEAVTFDTLVCTGLSGLLIVPPLARELTVALGKKINFLVVRKSIETHGNPVEGVLGKEWLFVDDFICYGNTARRVYKAVNDLLGWDKDTNDIIKPTFQGVYEYKTAHGDWANAKTWAGWSPGRHFTPARMAKAYYLRTID